MQKMHENLSKIHPEKIINMYKSEKVCLICVLT